MHIDCPTNEIKDKYHTVQRQYQEKHKKNSLYSSTSRAMNNFFITAHKGADIIKNSNLINMFRVDNTEKEQ